MDIEPSGIVSCKCNHMTTFGVFLRSSIDVIKNSNYNIWHGLDDITFAKLANNTGFYIVIIYWTSLALFGLICFGVDHVKLQDKFY